MPKLKAVRFADYDTGEPIKAATRKVMKANRGKNTGPEMALRRALHALGTRYRTHTTGVPGRPDICHQGAKVAVFVDGCFWHGCPRHFKVPKTRSDFWRAKIKRNRTKRRHVLKELGDEWTVFQFYECELKGLEEQAALEIADAIEAGRDCS